MLKLFKTAGAFFAATGIIVATTLGAGMFALPFVFSRAGIAVSLLYLAVVGIAIVMAHLVYWRVLARVDEKERLLGLTKKYLSDVEYWIGFAALVVGLLLTLVAYLILGAGFLVLIFPALTWGQALIIFWVINSAPLFFKERRIVTAELWGVAFMVAIILFIFFGGSSGGGLWRTQLDPAQLFLPFGAVFFALGAWPAIEPLYRSMKEKRFSRRMAVTAIVAGTLVSALLYFMFVVGIFGSAFSITPDTLGGLINWSTAKLALLVVLGLFAIWTSYLPIGLEIENTLVVDLGAPRLTALMLVVFVPVALIALGVSSFFAVVGVVGGVFVALQYLLIVRVGRKALAPRRSVRALFDILSLIILLAAVYEIYYFVVR